MKRTQLSASAPAEGAQNSVHRQLSGKRLQTVSGSPACSQHLHECLRGQFQLLNGEGV